ncbi:dermonecrotic toxin domain-containing protein [Pseudomonas sp. NPDC096950]|uniref:dermonecrotic toxin domain-containing protein n=1 Tax=Pseudomonas sp. NPDC096950 TaxID=3364485 RepID=UPI00383AC6EA
MTAPPLPYFFDEAETAAIARQPGDREKALNFSIDDLKWLKAIYLATDTARVAHKPGMQVHRLLLTPDNGTAIPLAGAFSMSRPNHGEAMLYTPWKGLIKYADINDLKSTVNRWLGESAGKRELLRYLSIEQRCTVLAASTLSVSTQSIDGAVFQDQETIIEANQNHNITTMLAELIKSPTLRSMLDEVLKNALARRFPGLDQRRTRLDSFAGTAPKRQLSSLSLSEAVLHYYLNNQWPDGDTRGFIHPARAVSSDADNLTWEVAIKEIAQSLTPHLRSLLDTFWNSPMGNGLARSEFFAQSLADTYCVDLLLKRQQGILTSEEYLRLMDVTLAGTDDLPASNDPVRIEKVRISAPLKHYVEPACTLMIGTDKSSAFLYTQARGVETSGSLGQIKNTLLGMLKSEGHDDNLFNFLSLEDRGLFLSLEEQQRVILGAPISGPVFAYLMADVMAKQRQNLTYALSRYRESAGVLDPHALLDNALDVRALIDKRLLPVDANGRWSTRADQRWSAQPATMRADSAKQQLALLASVENSLQQQLQIHPAISSAVTTLAQAEDGVRASLELLKPKFAHTLSTALRSELKLRGLSRTLGSVEQTMVQAVLDTPVRIKRSALNGFLPDVFGLALKADGADPLKLASCFVLTERGGLDPEHSGKTVLWTPGLGFEAFPSLTPMRAELNRRLLSDFERHGLLENLQRSERVPGRIFTLAPLQLIHEDFLEHLQKPYVQLDKTLVERALASSLPTRHRADLLSLTALAIPKTGLQRATDIAQSLITRQKIPAWLANASLEDQILHTELLAQYLNNVTDDKDYLSGIRSLERTTHHELHKQLKADKHNVDPDTVEIRISPRATSDARTQTLPAFALIHLHDLDTLSFKPASRTNTALPAGLDETYIKNLIRNLKPGEHQRAELTQAFAESHADAATRKQRFAKQLPWQLLHYAHAEKLQERLSPTGFDLIRQVIDMPDAIARDAVEGSNAIIRPLELSGANSETAIKVPGVYLIGPKKDADGPQVLLAPYSPEHGVKEYENESTLLTELKTTGALQRWVLNSLSPADRTLCKTRLAATGTPASLASSPIKGSLFQQLFKDNAELLARLLGCQSDKDGQSEWATIKHVLGEDVDQALTFVSGKLAYPVTVWRSYRDIKDSVEDLQEHKWGAATKAFVRGMAQLAMLRESMDTREPSPLAVDTATACERIDITAPERTRLQRHESTDVDLGSLALDSKLGLYTNAATKQHYAPIDGKVYPIQKRGSRWIIRSDKLDGPYALQNATKKWVLDADVPTPRYNLLQRLKTWNTVSHGMNVEADGMSEIRQLFPVRARLIDEGLDLATTYAWNSFRNLQLLKTTSSRTTPVQLLIRDFLDVPQVLPEHVTMIEKVVQEILGGLLDPTLRREKSTRFVIGRAKEEAEHILAFAIPADDRNKIYLAEKFFFPKFDHYRNYMKDASFPINTHTRAVTLIHELSHIVCKTEDIAYLDSSRPFADLIETTTLRAIALKDTLTDIQSKALSNRTLPEELFAVFNPEDETWEDFGETTFEYTDRALAHVLRLTGKDTLDEARTAFREDATLRLAVQLGNADSVSWLISQLGRQLHTRIP